MSMAFMVVALCVLVLSGFGAWLMGHNPRVAGVVGAGGAALGCALGIIPAAAHLFGAPAALNLGWNVPAGALSLGMDPLSSVFLVPILFLSGLAAVYGRSYLRAERKQERLGVAWLSYDLLVASMLVVVMARNAVLFLVAWEAMSVASFLLVMFEHEDIAARRASFIYLVAMQLGTLFLLLLFVLLSNGGSFEFQDLRAVVSPAMLFLLAVVGFGVKAGFVPFHVWLPEAHPAAPSHVSAVMSGVMIKTGLYGLLRVLTFLGPPPAWWGWLLVGIGLSSGLLGVLFALAQHDLKRLLAYHSVENVGIICLGIGVGVLGLSQGNGVLAFLGFAGGLLHVVNHSLFKGLLFLGAGAVLRASGTRDIDRLGGLMRDMPATAVLFGIGAAAIVGLPPFNGFVSEYLVYLGALERGGLAAVLVIGGLGLIGGLAAACFAKAFGVVFLGEPRTRSFETPADPDLWMRIPMIALGAACLLLGVAGPAATWAVSPAVEQLSGGHAVLGVALSWAALTRIPLAAALLIALVATLALVRWLLLRSRSVQAAPTWDCGYVATGSRMQYTASSFASPIVGLFHPVLRTRERRRLPEGPFPGAASFASDTPDPFQHTVYAPLFRAVERAARALSFLQHGRVHLYVLYVALTLAVLLFWRL